MNSSQWSRFLAKQPDYKDPTSSSSPLPALYADLAAHRSSNRSSFEASIDWWARLLCTACLQRVQTASFSPSSAKGKQVDTSADRLVLHVHQQLIEELTLNSVGRPLGLGTVTMELQSSRHVYSLRNFLNSTSPVPGPSAPRKGLFSLAYRAASAPIVWTLSQLSLSLGFGEGDTVDAGERDWQKGKGDWVLWDNLQALSDAVLSVHRSSARLSPLESLFSVQTFRTHLIQPALSRMLGEEHTQGETEGASLTCSALDLQVLLKFMQRDKAVLVSDGKVVKLEHFEGQTLTAISEEERGIVNVKDTYFQLQTQADELERRIQERQTKIEAAVKSKKREQAISHLRSRRMLEEVLDKRVKSLETLHGVLLKIEQAATDVEIVKAYETSTTTLKKLLSDARLQPERIDASMDQMQETLADADEVRKVIETGQEGVRRAAGEEELDDDEIDAELARLEEETRKEQEVVTKANDKATKEEEAKSESQLHTDPPMSEAAEGPSTEKRQVLLAD